MKIIIVGAGIGGLTAAIGLRQDNHDVVVLDQASEFGEVGAGMRIPPNCFKILHRWGVDFTYMKKTHSNGNRFLRYDSGHVLSYMPHGIPEWDYGGSYLMVHRADYHAVLLQKAVDLGVTILKNSRVVEYDWNAPAVKVGSNDWITGDVIIAADGVQSKARGQILGRELPPIDTGDIVYRVLIPGQLILSDPELRDLLLKPWVSSWCGPGAHVIGYPIRGGEVYNVVFCCDASSLQDEPMRDGETKKVVNDNTELVRRFAGWCPQVQKLVGHTSDSFLKWGLYDIDLVERWVHPNGKAALLGDACHPMLPYMASGAAMACEDAAVLRRVLSKATKDDVPAALLEYQDIRRPRASAVQKAGRTLQHWYHVDDGEQQVQRDKLITEDVPQNPIFWGHRARSDWLFGHDADLASLQDTPIAYNI